MSTEHAVAVAEQSIVALHDAHERIAALEATNAALVAFVEAYDAHQAFRETTPEDGYELWIAKWEHLKCKAKEARHLLATDHGIPLPGEGVEG